MLRLNKVYLFERRFRSTVLLGTLFKYETTHCFYLLASVSCVDGIWVNYPSAAEQEFRQRVLIGVKNEKMIAQEE